MNSINCLNYSFFNIKFIILLFILSFATVYSQSPSICSKLVYQDLNYQNCSSIYCTSCLNAYQCSQCSTNDQPLCCPKFCVKCLDMTHCLQCQTYFYLKYINNTIICSRAQNLTDLNRNSSAYTSVCNNQFYFQKVTSTCLPCNVSNCQTCSSYQNCTQCYSGFYISPNPVTNLINQTFSLGICKPCIQNCINCTNLGQCFNCVNGYFPGNNNTSCLPCAVQNCISCNVVSTCIQCVTTTYLLNNQCMFCSYAIQNCVTCSTNSNKPYCTSCAFGFTLTGNNQCTACPANCQNCTLTNNSFNCNSCMQNYILNTNTSICISCGTGCLNCTFNSTQNATNCITCQLGYRIVYNPNTQTLSCSRCPFPCLTCYNYTIVCGQCQTGFYVNYEESDDLEIGQCYFCNIQNCISCTSSQFCTNCEVGFYVQFSVTDSAYICQPCPGQCAACFVANITLNSSPQCIKCLPGYILQNTNCVSCNKTPNCLACNPNNTQVCTQCFNGFYPLEQSGIVCQVCGLPNCNICTTGPQFNLNINGNCLECQSGFYLINITSSSHSSNIECALCGNNCFTCLNYTFCQQCIQGYYTVNQENFTQGCNICPQQCLTCNMNGCIFCADGFYPLIQKDIQINQKLNTICLPCDTIQGCVSCFNKYYCKQCTPVRYSVMPSTLGDCTLCPQGCITCDNDQICSECQQGYLLQTQTNVCLDEVGIPIWGMFMIITFSIGITFVLVDKAIRWLHEICKKQQQSFDNYEKLQQSKQNQHEVQLKSKKQTKQQKVNNKSNQKLEQQKPKQNIQIEQNQQKLIPQNKNQKQKQEQKIVQNTNVNKDIVNINRNRNNSQIKKQQIIKVKRSNTTSYKF